MTHIFNQSSGLVNSLIAVSIYSLSVYSALERSDPYLALSSYFSGAFFVVAPILLGESMLAMCNSDKRKVYFLGCAAIFIWLLAGVLPEALFDWNISNGTIADLHALITTCLERALWTVSLIGFISLLLAVKSLGNFWLKNIAIAIAILGAFCSVVLIV